MRNLYFDNAATSFPKPPSVARAVAHYIDSCGGTYSRGAYPRALEGTRMVEGCRDLLAEKIGCSDGEHIIFTSNATMASNMLLRGLPLSGAHILVSALEHNAVMRPLEYLRKECGLSWSVLPHHSDGSVDLERLEQCSKEGVVMVIVSHVSNLNGVIQPLAEIKRWAGDIPLAVDCSQSAGHEEICVERDNIDYLILTGHKGLMGLTGSGALYVKEGGVKPLLYGGTSTLSHSMYMPTTMPDGLEAGTPNMVAICGLKAALESGVTPCHSRGDVTGAIERIKDSGKYTVYCALRKECQSDLFSVVHNSLDNSTLADILFSRYGIECRSGMLCSPLAHSSLGTSAAGVVRFSFSPYHSKSDIDFLVDSLLEL